MAEDIYGEGSEQALTITLHQVAFDSKRRAQPMDGKAVETLEKVLARLEPEARKSQQSLLRRAFFKKERIQVAMPADLVTRLWQATASKGLSSETLAGIAKNATVDQIKRLALDKKGRPKTMKPEQLDTLEQQLDELESEDRRQMKEELRSAFFKGERNVTSMGQKNSLRLWKLTATSLTSL